MIEEAGEDTRDVLEPDSDELAVKIEPPLEKSALTVLHSVHRSHKNTAQPHMHDQHCSNL